jgi:hypothetical protein
MKNYKEMAIASIKKRSHKKNELKLLSVFFVSAKVINAKQMNSSIIIKAADLNICNDNFVKAFGGYFMGKDDKSDSPHYVRKLNNFWITL